MGKPPPELVSALQEVDGALAGWEAVTDDVRAKYVSWVRKPWLTRERRFRAGQTAAWARAGQLQYVHPDLGIFHALLNVLGG